jgi:hypothetical protein
MSKKANTPAGESASTFKWRDYIKVHPAAEEFPPLSEVELRELAEDIRAYGLREQIIFWIAEDGSYSLLDGRSRLDAMALGGMLSVNSDGNLCDGSGALLHCRSYDQSDGDPRAIVLSLNVLRRHLTPEQRREKIAAELKAHPERSDRAIAADLGVGKDTVRRSRKSTGADAPVKKRIGKDGKKRRPPRPKRPAEKVPPPATPSAADDAKALGNGVDPGAHEGNEPGAALPRDVPPEPASPDALLEEFDKRVGWLARLIEDSEPSRFIKTTVPTVSLQSVSRFLARIVPAPDDLSIPKCLLREGGSAP